MRKAFFIWRHNSKGYDPMICYDELPTSREPSIAPRIAAVHELPANYIQEDGEVWQSFKALAELFPPPIDDVGIKVKLDAS